MQGEHSGIDRGIARITWKTASASTKHSVRGGNAQGTRTKHGDGVLRCHQGRQARLLQQRVERGQIWVRGDQVRNGAGGRSSGNGAGDCQQDFEHGGEDPHGFNLSSDWGAA